VRVVVLVAVVLVVTACGSRRHVVAQVTPRTSVEAEAVDVTVRGLNPNQIVTLRLRSTDAVGVKFASEARFRAGANGVVDLRHAKPLAGSSYSTVWPMGLLTSMKAVGHSPLAYYQWRTKAQTFRLTATSGGRAVARASFTRRFTRNPPKIIETTVSKEGFLGTFYAPHGAVHKPAVLVFGGSNGGTGSLWEGEQLAAEGIPALEIGYFHAPTLPDKLVNIPLEYFRTALRWLERRPEVDARRTALLTASYGTEAALLIAVHYPVLVDRIVALTPSGVVTCGIAGAHRPEGCLGSPWTFRGKPVAYTKLFDDPRPFDVPQAVIPVERIKTPVFLSCGGNDTVWRSCPYARAIVQRRRGERTDLYVYPNAGHYSNGAFFEYEPGVLPHDQFVPADERAREDLTPRVLSFLRSA
jgi:pimeloyl-ACP methyl ester carboxylesterase